MNLKTRISRLEVAAQPGGDTGKRKFPEECICYPKLQYGLSLRGDEMRAAVIPNSVPAYVTRAQNLGPENPNRVIEISVDLAVRDPLGRDALLKELYDPNSPLYQKWLTPEEYAARFGPTAQQAAMESG